ncbi:putative bifunctional diguanylate cyclase/phosphodiesterase [Cryptosporangium minutisporangium]
MVPPTPAVADLPTDGLVVRTRTGEVTPMDGGSATSALAREADRRAARERTITVVAIGATLLAPWLLYVLPGPLTPTFYLAIVVWAIAWYAVGVAARRPSPAWPWWLIGAGVLARFCGLIAAEVVPHHPVLPESPLTVALAIRLVSFPLLVAGLIGIVKRSGPFRTQGIVDGLAVSYGVGTIGWLLVLAPYLRALSGAERALAFVFVIADLTLLTMAVIVLVVAIRHTAQALVGLASLLFVAGDFLWGVDSGAHPVGMIPTAGPGVIVLSGYLFLAIAAGHRSTAVRRQEPQGELPAGRLKMALFGAATFAYPAFAVFAAVEKRPIDPLVDVAYPVAMTTGFCFYLAVRSAGLARDAYRREQEQAAQAAALGAALAEQQALQGQLTYRALHDPLTGLPNRSKLTDALDGTLADARRPEYADRPYALVLVDLDGFKDVNDTHGHPVGDELLIQVAARFTAALPEGTLLARLGGDEFAVLLTDADTEHASMIGRRLTEALWGPFRVAAHDLYLTTSVGLYVGTGPATPSDVLRNADLALYAAKGGGKNQVVGYRPELRTAHLEQVELLAGLRRAVAMGEFVLEYQPVVDLVTERISSVEALLRWDAPGAARVSPADFVPVAEESGLIVPIGAWVLGQACVDATDWYSRFGISVAVNVATAQLRDPEFVTTVLGALRFSGLPPQALVLEITESTMIAATAAETEIVVARLQQLRSRGIRIAIDDFGTGYSSLSYLRRLPVDILKIDRAFSMEGPEGADSEDTALTKAILQLSHSLGLSTVAEGVETAERADVLRELRCDRAQGFLYSKPVDVRALDALLEAPHSLSSR